MVILILGTWLSSFSFIGTKKWSGWASLFSFSFKKKFSVIKLRSKTNTQFTRSKIIWVTI